MGKWKALTIAASYVLICTVGCDQKAPTASSGGTGPNTTDSRFGKAAIYLPKISPMLLGKKTAALQNAKIVLTISADDMDSMHFSWNVVDSAFNPHLIQNIPVGKNRLFTGGLVNAYGILTYSGSAITDINANTITQVYLNLKKVVDTVVVTITIDSTAQVDTSTLPDTFPTMVKVPVTFYDFHSDGSNPEFGKTSTGSAIRLGMVANSLNVLRKPILGTTPFYNCDIAKWFVPWTSGDFAIPNYSNPATTACDNGTITVTYDTAFKNIVIQDTLTFMLVSASAGTYQFNNASFFPLDGRGFGNESAAGKPSAHNYSFAMEMHGQFTYQKNLTFDFASDGDMWIYIDGSLAIDLGGIHNASFASINLDYIPGLTIGKRYRFDVFFAQRGLSGSTMRITTNL